MKLFSNILHLPQFTFPKLAPSSHVRPRFPHTFVHQGPSLQSNPPKLPSYKYQSSSITNSITDKYTVEMEEVIHTEKLRNEFFEVLRSKRSAEGE